MVHMWHKTDNGIPQLVYFPGWGMDHRSFVDEFPDLSIWSCSDTVGFLESPSAYIDSLKKLPKSCVLAGFSLGCLAVRLLSEEFSSVRKVCIGMNISYEGMMDLVALIENGHKGFLRQFYKNCIVSSDYRRRFFADYFLSGSASEKETLIKGLHFLDRADFSNWLNSGVEDLHVINGDQDIIVNLEKVQLFKSAFASFTLINHSGHILFDNSQFKTKFRSLIPR